MAAKEARKAEEREAKVDEQTPISTDFEAGTQAAEAAKIDSEAPESPQSAPKRKPRRVEANPDAKAPGGPPPLGTVNLDYKALMHGAAVQLSKANEEIAKEGLVALPPVFWMSIWEPMAVYCMDKVAGSLNPDHVAWPVFLAGPTVTLVQGIRAGRKRKNRGPEEIPSPNGKPQQAPTVAQEMASQARNERIKSVLGDG